MGEGRVSIIVVTHNRAESLLRTLAHLRTFACDARVLVVDNASSDTTAASVRRWYPDVALLSLPSNTGAYARTIGAQAVSSPYLAFCDDDCWWDSSSLASGVELLDRYPPSACSTRASSSDRTSAWTPLAR